MERKVSENKRLKAFLLRRARISFVEQKFAGFTNDELKDAGYRIDGTRGWRLES